MTAEQLLVVEQLRRLQSRLAGIEAEAEQARSQRQSLVQQLLNSGMTLSDVAVCAGVTRQRVHQWGLR